MSRITILQTKLDRARSKLQTLRSCGHPNDRTTLEVEALEKLLETENSKQVVKKDRKTILLEACHALLKKCDESYYVISPMETTVFYDEADCDGSCLMEDIADELGIDSE